MRLGRLSLCLLGLGSALACARPSLEEELGDAGLAAEDAGRDSTAPAVTQERDAAVVMEPVEDASRTTEPDASCADRDGDRVCDAKDNCPEDANADQVDADGDGTGDACEIIQVACDGDGIERVAISNSATLARMMINGTSDRVVQVKPGETVTVRFSLTFNDCAAVSFQQVVFGIESETPTCQPTGCTSGVEIPLPYEFELQAPTDPGLHYLLAGIQTALSPVSCSSGGSSRPDAGMTAAKRVAALCVSAK